MPYTQQIVKLKNDDTEKYLVPNESAGIIDKNSGDTIYQWKGTKAQWEAGRANHTIPDDWICLITDDSDTVEQQKTRGIYDAVSTVTPVNGVATIKLSDSVSIYNLKPVQNTRLVFDTSDLNQPEDTEMTFYVNFDMTEDQYDITFPENVQWGNISPSFTAMCHYKLVFTSPDRGTTWIGSEMFTWL